MLRPTRSRLVTETHIVGALRSCNMIKTKSFSVQIVGISVFASWEATAGWLTLEPSPRLRGRLAFLLNLADGWRGFNRNDKTGRELLRNQASSRLERGRLVPRRQPAPRGFAAPQMRSEDGQAGGDFPLVAGVPKRTVWHFNCLVRIGRWWPGTRVVTNRLRFPTFRIINS